MSITFEPPPGTPKPDDKNKAKPLTDEDIAIIKSGIGYIVPIPWPANPLQWVGMRCLSRAETRKLSLEALASARRIGKQSELSPEEIAGIASRIETDLVLWTSLRDCVWAEQPDGTLAEVRQNPTSTLIMTADLFAQCTTEKHVRQLIAHYDDILAASAPLTRFQQMILSAEYEKAWTELKKKPDARVLIGLSSAELVPLLSFIAHLYQERPETSET